MNHQEFVNCISVPCAVLSVERTADGSCGEIHIVCSNQSYKEAMGPAYYDNMIYSELVPKDPKFEDFCFRAAFRKERMHAYVEVKALSGWIDQIMIPMEPASERLGYCQFLFEYTEGAEADRMAGVSMDTAPAAIKACVTLLGAKDFTQGVNQVLSDIVEFSGAFHCRIMLIDHEKRRAINFCEAYRDLSLVDTSKGTGSIPYEVVDSWEAMIGVSNNIIVKDSRDMDELERQNPSWVGAMRHYGVESLALVPLRRASNIIGYLYVINFDVSRVVKVKELIELTSFFLSSEISNYLHMNQLKELSTVDALTGLQNRNAMSRRIAEIDEQGLAPFGLVNVDLNGLKVANDRYGHDAGDELLRQAATILRKAFRQDDLYRMGGDEFLVIAVGISQGEFNRRVDILHDSMKDSAEVSFSIGALWSDGTTDVSSAYKRADAIMYANKEAYYASNPNLIRH